MKREKCYICAYNLENSECSQNGLCVDYDKFGFIGDNSKGNPIQPKHYSNGGNDVIDYCYKNDIDFLTGNIIKYVVRAGKKDKSKELEDLQKAQEYLRRRIEYLKGE